MSSTFRNRLIEAMGLREMTQADLAKATGLSKPRISQYVNGTYEAKQQALYKLAKALNVSISWLMGNDVSMEATQLDLEGWDKKFDTQKLSAEVAMWDFIGQRYGERTAAQLNGLLQRKPAEQERIWKLLEGYSKLDNEDRIVLLARAYQILEDMLAAEKYSKQDGGKAV